MTLYQNILRPFIFQFDCEAAHHLVMRAAQLGRSPFISPLLKPFFSFEDPRLAVDCLGLHFDSPIGLAAGFDKECRAPEFFHLLGFDSIEVGSITAQAQEGNPRPRIFRLIEDHALINRMGFPSDGIDTVETRLRAAYTQQKRAVLGVNIGKTKIVPIDDALEDYLITFRRVQDISDYIVINVSSPNTPELRKLQEKERLKALLRGIQEANTSRKALLVKVAPDLSFAELDEVLECCEHCGLSGIIATNTTFLRDGLREQSGETGGLSGAPLFEKSRSFVEYIYRRTEGKLPIIGVGGIANAEQAFAMIRSGASLLQIYTALIYEGPGVAKNIKIGLVKLLEREGFRNISETVGQSAMGQNVHTPSPAPLPSLPR